MLTARETATVLAALRLWQQTLQEHGTGLTEGNLHFADQTPLSVTQIDGLCQWFNLAEACEEE